MSDITSNLVGYWALDENPASNSSTLADSSGNSYSLTLTTDNGATNKSVAGHLGQAISFDGDADYALSSSVAFVTTTAAAHSFFAWIYPTANAAVSIINFGEVVNTNYTTCLGLSADGHLCCYSNGVDTGAYQYLSTLDVSLNAWSFVGVVRTATNMRFYVNANRENYATTDDETIGATDKFAVGCAYANGTRTGYFSGYIDEVRAYTRSLSDDDADAVYAYTAKHPLIDALSTADAGFTAGHPFASGEAKEYTVQSALTASTTYYWRVKAKDGATASNSYGAWSSTYSFATGAGGTSVNVSETAITPTESVLLYITTQKVTVAETAITQTETLLLYETSLKINVSETAIGTPTETVTLTGAGSGTTYSINVAETTITQTETIVLYETSYKINVSETNISTLTETVTIKENPLILSISETYITPTESLIITEVSAGVLSLTVIETGITPTETLTLYETSYKISVSETAITAPTELLTLYETSLKINVVETAITPTDVATIKEPTLYISVFETAIATPTETLTLYETSYRVNVSETAITLTESFIIAEPTLYISVTETTTVSELSTITEGTPGNYTISVSETPITVTDSNGLYETTYFIFVAESNITVSDAGTIIEPTLYVNVAESDIIFTETLTLSLSAAGILNLSVSEVIGGYQLIFIVNRGRVAVRLSGNNYLEL